MRRTTVRALCALGAGALAVPLLSAAALAAPADHHRVALSHSKGPAWANSANRVGAVPGSRRVSARVYLAPRGGQAALDAAVAAVSTPGSSSYRHFLTEPQYVARFAPSSSAVSSVESWLKDSGLAVTGVESHHRYVAVSGTAKAVHSAFGVTVSSYRHNGTVEQSTDGTLSAPDDVAALVSGVTGLTTAQRLQHGGVTDAPPPAGFANARPCSAYFGQVKATYQADYKTKLPKFAGSTRNYAVCGYTPAQYRAAYGATKAGLTGKGVTVGIIDAYNAPTMVKDSATYSTRRGDAPFTRGQYTVSLPKGAYRHQALCGPSGWYGEQTLDVEAVHGMAPDAKVRYYAGRSCYNNDLQDATARVVDENKVDFVSNSYGNAGETVGSGEIAADQAIFEQAALQGIGFLFSSGDSGDDQAATGTIQADYPATSPYVTAVGGTSDAISASGQLEFQASWGTNKYSLSANGKSWEKVGFLYGAGGGYSHLFNQPNYQNGVVKPGAGGGGRAVPDISMDADPNTGMLIGETQTFSDGVRYGEYRIGGTSLASPLFAGMQALAAQKAGTRLGFANPAIYRIAKNSPNAINDVTDQYGNRANVRADYANGENATDGILYSIRTFGDDSSLTAEKGWDDSTGVGSPNGDYFRAAARRAP